MNSQALTITDLADLKNLVTQIDSGLSLMGESWRRIGAAAKEIRERELWRKESSSWNEFCEKHDWSRRRLNELIRSEETMKSLGFGDEVGATALSEEAASQLAKVPIKKRKKALKAAVESGGATAKNIREAIDAEVIHRDETKYEIPKQALPFWLRRQEIQDLMSAVSQAKCAIEKAHQQADPLFLNISQGAIDHLSRAYQFITDGKPFAVCLECQGRDIGKCRMCKGTGLVSKEKYLIQSCQTKRVMREKTYKLQPMTV